MLKTTQITGRQRSWLMIQQPSLHPTQPLDAIIPAFFIKWHSDLSMPSPLPFCAQELESVLREQSFGIHEFIIVRASSLECSASVTLLEGHTIQVTLKYSGYCIESDEQNETRQETFETIENLLSSASPLFEQKRQEALMAALERLA